MLRRRAPLLGVMVIFAGLGIILLSISSADAPVDGAVANISLAPADVTVEQGDLINVAVNLDTNGQVAKDVEATVEFPSAALQLQSVQSNCSDPAFEGAAKQDTQTGGKVVVGCKSDQGVDGQHTVATLVFKALASSSDAPLTVSDNSTVMRKNDGKKVLGSRSGATMRLQSHTKSSIKKQRAIPDYKSRKVCKDPAPDEVQCMAQVATSADGDPLTTAQATSSGLGPKELHMGYQVPCTPGGPVAAVCATPSTYGPQTVAIVDAGNYAKGVAGLESDLQLYNQKYGIAACTVASGCLTVMNQTGGTTLPKDAGWSDEMILDVTAVHMMCQTCKIILVESNDATVKTMETANSYAASLHPIAVSDSWSGNTGNESSYNHPGVAQIIADGDDGVLTTNNSPADFPGVVVASGTTLKVNTDGTWASETLWSKSGGGCSPSGTAASWQTSLPNWSTAGCGTKRGYGDMSAVADPATGLVVYQDGTASLSGGTSLSAPLIAGMFALAGNMPSTTVAPSTLYANNTSANFHDIISGSDCTTSAKAHCTAAVGFDIPTGLGTPMGLGAFKTSTSITPTPTPPPPPTPTPPPPTPPTPPPTTPPTPGTKPGDLNGDNQVNITDMSLLLSAWGKSSPTADLNKSGKVDIADLSILLSNYGK